MNNVSKKIKIMIIDDHQIVRTGLKALINIESDISVVAEASSGQEAMEIFPQHLPDVTLVDLRLPDIDGIKTLAAIRRQFPSSKFIMLTSYHNDAEIHRASEAGAAGYLLKGMFNYEFIKAIRSVHLGLRYFPQEIGESLSSRPRPLELTDRELEVLRLLIEGKNNKEMAAALREGVVDLAAPTRFYQAVIEEPSERVSIG